MSEAGANRAEGLTALLHAWHRGEAGALDRVMPAVYDELRQLAARHLANERAGHTLQTTALVHEAYLRLAGQEHVDWKNRAYFFGAVANVMRRVLVDHARRRSRDKRGGGLAVVALEQVAEPAEPAALDGGIDVQALDDALDRLAAIDARQARIVELRFFAGMTIEEIAAVLTVSAGTVKRDWTVARAWLFAALRPPSS
jgi:RNA polymerase sigma factor (TIGR02999 family)